MVLYTVLLDVDNDDNTLMAEMTTHIFFIDGRAQDTLTIPLAALQADGQSVMVVGKGNDLQTREIHTGLRDRLSVQVLSGLDEGDRLLLGPAPGGEG